jgi:sporulation protein YlmC with PRC-barrel domain
VATTTRVFVGRLAQLSVFDPLGEKLGRVRDVVVTFSTQRTRPRVIGLVIEVGSRKRIFVPMTRVISVEGGQVLTTGLVNVRRFEQRANETLVLAELVERHVQVKVGGEFVDAIIEDIGLEQAANRAWSVTRAFVRKRTGGSLNPFSSRRRGETFVTPIEDVLDLREVKAAQSAARLLETYQDIKPADLAEVIHDLAPKRRAEVAAALDDDRLADVIEELPADDQIEILVGLQVERAADVLEAMEPDDAADLLSELPPERQEELLLMDQDEAEDLRRLLTYDDEHGGRSDDHRAGHHRDRRRPSPRRWPWSGAKSSPPRSRPPSSSAGHRSRRRPAATSAWSTSSVCCASHPMHRSAASSTRTSSRSLPMRVGPGHSHAGELQHGGPTGRGRRVRCPARCRDRGRRARPHPPRGLARGPARAGPGAPRGGSWLSVARSGWTSPARTSAASPSVVDDERGLRPHLREVRPLHGDRAVPHRMTVFVGIWLIWNTWGPKNLQFDPRDLNYTLLTLILSLQASYAAPLILLAQNRQADRDRVATEQDRSRDERNLADTEFLTREVAALRLALRETATRDFVRSELRTYSMNSRNVGCGSPPIPGSRRQETPGGEAPEGDLDSGACLSSPQEALAAALATVDDPRSASRSPSSAWSSVHLRRGRTGRRDHPAHRLRLPAQGQAHPDTTAALMKVEGVTGRGHPRGDVGRAARRAEDQTPGRRRRA